MVWKTIIGVLAAAAAVIGLVARRHRRPHRPELGEVSPSWIAEHKSGLDV